MIKKLIHLSFFFVSLLPLSAYSGLPDLNFRDRYDIVDITCADELTQDEEFIMIIWLDGYLAALQGKTASSKEDMAKLEYFLVSECKKSGEKTIASIIERYYLFSGWALP